MNTTQLSGPRPAAHEHTDAEIFGAIGKGLLIGALAIFPLLMLMFAAAFSMDGGMLIGVSIGTLMMAELLGALVGMGLYLD